MKHLKFPERDLIIAKFIQSRRRAANLTQRELGDLAGVGKRFLVELESGKPTLKMDKVNQVLTVFGMRLGPVVAGPAEVVSPIGAVRADSGRREPRSEAGSRSST